MTLTREELLAAVLDEVVAGDPARAERITSVALPADPVWAGALHAFSLFMHRRLEGAARSADTALAAADPADALGLALARSAAALAAAGIDGRPSQADPLDALAGDLPRGGGAAAFIRYLASEAALASARVGLAAKLIELSGPRAITHPYAAVEAVMRVRALAFNGRIADAAAELALIPKEQPPALQLLVEAAETLVLGNAAERTAVRALADALEAQHPDSDTYISSGCYLLVAFGLVAVGDVQRAAQLTLQAGGDADLSGYITVDRGLAYELLVAAAVQEGDVDAAESWAARAAALAGSPIAGSTIDRLTSRVALLRGRTVEALDLAECAVREARTQGRVVEAREGEIVAARARIAAAAPGEAGVRLRDMVAEADARGHAAARMAAARELRAVGRRLLPTAGSELAGLSERERDVALMVAGGLSNREIASALHLSEHTVRVHVSRVLAAFGAASRARVATGMAEFLPAVNPPVPLTPRQRAVAVLIARGAGNAEIARDLGISVKTVEMHVSDVLERWGMRSRVEIARAARSLQE